MKKLRIGFVGNFVPPYSTENDRKWSFERLGHKVIPFQENKVTSDLLLESINDLDMLIYSHTHGWTINGLKQVFVAYKLAGVPTVSVHLDRWAGLEREKDIGKEATWSTEYVFMADGSPEAVDLYNKHKLNWYWLKPGVVERDCKIVTQPTYNGIKPYKDYEIVFAGSRDYHPEYPFRPKLVDFLKKTYGDRFGHFGKDGITVARGTALNYIYSNAKIVIGDSCFGGRPRYVSDRYYEVRGRGGVLLHPHVEGVDTNGVINYEAGSLDSLEAMIELCLKETETTEEHRRVGFNHVVENETYTHRSAQMLGIIFNE